MNGKDVLERESGKSRNEMERRALCSRAHLNRINHFWALPEMRARRKAAKGTFRLSLSQWRSLWPRREIIKLALAPPEVILPHIGDKQMLD